MSGLFFGNGRLLIACAEHWLSSARKIVAVVSGCPDVVAWSKSRGVSRIETSELASTGLDAGSFDFLFSIVNHAIIPPDILALPSRQAINYHDSLLPRFSGFNATSWALIHGQVQHGVTWHEMSGDVDSGPILLQQHFDILEDDTAYSLGAKCAEAGLTSFCRLVETMTEYGAGGKAPPISAPQARQDFHLRSDRPSVGLIDLAQPAANIGAFVRALDLGTDDNWMCRPKLALPSGVCIVGEAEVDQRTGGMAGEVLDLDEASIVISAAGGSIRCSRLTTLEGIPIDISRLDLEVGQHLLTPAMSAGLALNVAEQDAALSRHERFWVERLAAQRMPLLNSLRPHAEGCDLTMVFRRPAGLGKTVGREVIVAAFAAYLSRVGDGAGFDLSLGKDIRQECVPFYSDAAPMRFDVSLADGFSRLIEQTRAEIAIQDRRGTYARDAVTRYRVLRANADGARPPAIGVRFQSIGDLDAGRALVAGTHLTLVAPSEGADIAWVYDRLAISDAEVSRLADRVEILLATALADLERPISELDIVSLEERDLLLDKWQGEHVPCGVGACIHELFEAQVARTPDAIAVRFEGDFLTYRQLDGRSNCVAQALKSHNVGPEVLVAVCIERSLDLIVGLLGVLKAGGAYVPLDAAYPRERLRMMLEDSRADLVLTQRHLVDRLPQSSAQTLCIESIGTSGSMQSVQSGVEPDNLAYVIFTSGSTGRPKGVMVRHANVVNFFTGMDERIGSRPGVWLAVTSISFDISVLELFWTLARGFEVVIQRESDRATLSRQSLLPTASAPMAFGLFYFAADQGDAKSGGAYRLLLEGARFADTHDFSAVWTPERHFHAFGGLYPNPAVTTAALSTITNRIALRAGSVVLPLHNPLRVAEDWAVVDQLSGGRVGLSFASGWHADDFALMPENYERRREIMVDNIETVLRLWRGESVDVKNGQGKTIQVKVLPRPLQVQPPVWIASAGSVDTFRLAGQLGANVLTNMLGQDIDDLDRRFTAYRAARREAGHEGSGTISVMLHTFICEDTERARELARKPFCDYLASSFDLIKVAPTMFPAFRRPSLGAQERELDTALFTAEDVTALMDHAFDRYFESAGLFGTPEKALGMINRLKAIGANEVACLIDFGIDPEIVLESLCHLDRLRELANQNIDAVVPGIDYGIASQINARHVTHMQCTPSMARMLANDADCMASLADLDCLLLGGEALPTDLAEMLLPVMKGRIHNMYGPTETTIWSTSSEVRTGEAITIGRPIVNTVIRVLDARGQLAPIGVPGELCIGGGGVVRGYLGRPDLTAERFVRDPYANEFQLYRTGDLCRYRDNGTIEFLGRMDHQVKVNGYRIELGEIEAVVGKHPGVRQCIVDARIESGLPRLVGYVIPTDMPSTAEGADTRVSRWRSLWNETYKQSQVDGDPRFNTAGWTSSFNGEPISASAMREWLDLTARSILALSPRRVAEIGCGSGMVLYHVLPHVEHYTAVDLSPHALDSIHRELTTKERAKVRLIQGAADALEDVVDGSFDTVVINSVCQYFPDAEYLIRVVRRASALVQDSGRIFIGDVRSREHLDAFHALAVLHQAPGHLTGEELARRTERRIEQDGELVLSEAFFHALARDIPRISAVEVRLKSGSTDTEMNAFRYDVVLHVGERRAGPLDLPQASQLTTLAAIRETLSLAPPIVVVEDIENTRLSAAYEVLRRMPQAKGETASEMRQILAGRRQGIDPSELFVLDHNYSVDLLPARSGDPARFDAVLRHKTTGPSGTIRRNVPQHDRPAVDYANRPSVLHSDNSALLDDLRAHVRDFLPDYMAPSDFVVVDAFPLTPNGKIDRKRLPSPTVKASRPLTMLFAPSNALELTIADIWKALLQVDQVELRENIFDAGANSLLAAQASQRLSEVLDRKVSLVSLFRFPTIESLAQHLNEDIATPDHSVKAKTKIDRKKDAAARRRELRDARTEG